MTAVCTAPLTRVREGDWVVSRLEANPDSYIRLAEANDFLEGNWKYVLEGPEDRLSLRLDELSDEEVTQDASPTLGDLKRRIESLGFRCGTRSDRIVVDLEHWHAEILPDAQGAWLSMVSILVPESGNARSREALALLMLRASGAMRMARGFLAGQSAGFAVRLPAACSEDAITASLDGLAACCRVFARSVSVLQSERAAAGYLALDSKPSTSRSSSQKGDYEDA